MQFKDCNVCLQVVVITFLRRGVTTYVVCDYDVCAHCSWSLQALGIIAFVLLCGCLPFDDDSSRIPSESAARKKFTLRFPKWASSLSSSAKDLLHNLLDVNPKNRFTAEQALHHPWVSGKTVQLNSYLQSPSLLGEFCTVHCVCFYLHILLFTVQHISIHTPCIDFTCLTLACVCVGIYVCLAGGRRKEMRSPMTPSMSAMQQRLAAAATAAANNNVTGGAGGGGGIAAALANARGGGGGTMIRKNSI